MEKAQQDNVQITTIRSIQSKIRSIDDFILIFGTQLGEDNKVIFFLHETKSLGLISFRY